MTGDNSMLGKEKFAKASDTSVELRRAGMSCLEKMMQHIAFCAVFLLSVFVFSGCGGGDVSSVEDLRKEVERLRSEVRSLRLSISRPVSRPSVMDHDINGHANASKADSPLQSGKKHRIDHRRSVHNERRRGVRDLEFREKMQDPEFRKKMRDPEFRRKMREERRSRNSGTNNLQQVEKIN